EIYRRSEAIGTMARRLDDAALPDSLDNAIHRLRIDAARILAGKAQDNGAIAAMSDAGKGQRPMQTGRDRGWSCPCRSWPITDGEIVKEAPRRRHRPHRVRTGGADTDLENVED